MSKNLTFRDSDVAEPRLHQSYHRKPVSILQYHSQLSHLNVSKKSEEYSTVKDVVPLPIPALQEEVYDPSHPDADWSGLVYRKALTRRHENNHVSQKVTLMQTEEGIVSKSSYDEFHRRRTGDKETKSLIGGTVNENFNPYLTDMRRGELGIKTENDQLSMNRKSLLKQKDVKDFSTVGGSQILVNINQPGRPDFSQSVSAPRSSHAPIHKQQSFLASIADNLLDDIPAESFPGNSRSRR